MGLLPEGELQFFGVRDTVLIVCNGLTASARAGLRATFCGHPPTRLNASP